MAPRIRVSIDREVTAVRGIPVTAVARTLLDLASVLAPHHLERAMNEAEVQRLTSNLSLSDLLARYPGHRGLRAIKAILERLETGGTVTKSDLEDRFLAFVRSAGLPRPDSNVNLIGFECDCVWPAQRVIVELDGPRHAWHHGRLRARSRPRPHPQRRRLAHGSRHMAPAGTGAGGAGSRPDQDPGGLSL